jgi:hypothetical protein
MPDQNPGALGRTPVVEPVGRGLVERDAFPTDERHRRGGSGDHFGERRQIEDRVEPARCGAGVVRERAEGLTPDRA